VTDRAALVVIDVQAGLVDGFRLLVVRRESRPWRGLAGVRVVGVLAGLVGVDRGANHLPQREDDQFGEAGAGGFTAVA
jgi:nicotinamidase-related amidase